MKESGLENGNLAIASQWAPPNRLRTEKEPVKSQILDSIEKIVRNTIYNANFFRYSRNIN